eukprot:COSAG01_NODE_7863_length_3021_cov_1.688227_4_plen_223_part_00
MLNMMSAQEPLFISRERHHTLAALGSRASAADASRLVGRADECILVASEPDLRPEAAQRALAWACCLLGGHPARHTGVDAEVRETAAVGSMTDDQPARVCETLPTELVAKVGMLLVRPLQSTGAPTPAEECGHTDEEMRWLSAARPPDGSQGQDCQEQRWSSEQAARVQRARYVGGATLAAAHRDRLDELPMLARDRRGGIRVMPATDGVSLDTTSYLATVL